MILAVVGASVLTVGAFVGPVSFPFVGANVGVWVGGDVVLCVTWTSSTSKILPLCTY